MTCHTDLHHEQEHVTLHKDRDERAENGHHWDAVVDFQRNFRQ